MGDGGLNRTALVLAAHGSHHEARVNESIRAHAAKLAAEGLFDEVWVAFHQGDPSFSNVLDRSSATQVVVVPVMTSAGYYCDEVLPRELAKHARVTNSGMARPVARALGPDDLAMPPGQNHRLQTGATWSGLPALDHATRSESPVANRCHMESPVTNRCHMIGSTFQLAITQPVGTHPQLVNIVAKRITAWCVERKFRPEEVAVVLVGHGTKRHACSRIATERLAAQVRDLLVCGETLVAFLDEEPLIDSIRARISRPHVLVMPFMIGGGPHAAEDIPRRMGVREGGGVFVDAPIGEMQEIRSIIRDLAIDGLNGLSSKPVAVDGRRDHAKVAGPAIDNRLPARRETIDNSNEAVARVRASKRPLPHPGAPGRYCPDSTFRLGTRCSALALWQARHVAGLLADRSVNVNLVQISTSGDRRLDCAISALGTDAPFTDDLDAALRSGAIDLAVHALKDLSVPPPDDLDFAAILPRGDVSEALVSHDGRTLAELPFGARVGTSSPRRAAQLLALRSDLRPTTIRGAVDDRVRQVKRGEFDAAILATAGLQRLNLTHEIAETFSPDVMLPAPGQGALVIQIRRDDDRLRARLAPLDHAPTRRAVLAELELLRRVQNFPDLTVAAWAAVDDNGTIGLQARLVSLDGSTTTNVCVYGTDPIALGHLAAEKLLSQSPITNHQSAISR